MSEINPNAPAFPGGASPAGNMLGLTKREYFAGLAMQGLAPRYASGNHSMATLAAKLAVESADALLAELAKQPVG